MVLGFSSRLAAVVVLIAASLLFSQSTTQSIQGLVTDSSGAVVVGAKVTARNVATGISRTVLTNNTGNYTFPLVPVGDYEMTVEMAGFKTEAARASGLRQPRKCARTSSWKWDA